MSEAIKALFGSSDFYAILGVAKDAPAAELRKAYYRLALKLHPDRNPGDEQATQKFQQLSLIYETLSDAHKRQVYDDTGLLPEDDPLADHQTRDWEAYWRTLYKQISRDDIEAFEKKYKGSAEEETDIHEAYENGKGSMAFIIDNVILATADDEDRFRAMLTKAIEAGVLRKHKAFTGESEKARTSRHSRYAKEAAEAEREAKKLHVDSADGLRDLILARQKSRGGALAALEARFSGSAASAAGAAAAAAGGSASRSGERSQAVAPPTDEEFLEAQKRVHKKASKSAGKAAR
jgi:DnaJ family protein C protein 9